eukprot:Gb_41087 [translate_table: standard]
MESFISRRLIFHLRNTIKQSTFCRTYYNRSSFHGNHFTSTSILSSQIPTEETRYLRPNRHSRWKLHFISNAKLVHSLPEQEHQDDDEEDGPMNEFLERFVSIMRSRLSEAYSDTSKEVIDGMLEIIVDKVVTEMEKGTLNELKDYVAYSSAETRDFSQELWKTVWEVSKIIIEDMRKAEMKNEIQKYLQSDEIKEISKFAKDVGITGDRLRDMKLYFAEQKRLDIEFFRKLYQMGREPPAAKRIHKGEKHAIGEGDESMETEQSLESEEKPRPSLPQRHGKLKHRVYGLNMADPKWTEVGEKLAIAERKIAPEEPTVMSGKCKALTKQIVSLADNENPSKLLTQWLENLKPSRVDWLALLQELNEAKNNLFFKATEYALNEEGYSKQ